MQMDKVTSLICHHVQQEVETFPSSLEGAKVHCGAIFHMKKVPLLVMLMLPSPWIASLIISWHMVHLYPLCKMRKMNVTGAGSMDATKPTSFFKNFERL